jgi:hypothetical protein
VSGKSTKLVIQQRVEEIFRLRLGGAEFHDIREYADATADQEGKPRQPWGVSDTQLRRYIAKADALCKERFDAHAPYLLNRHLLQRRRLFAHAMEVGDYKTAHAVLKDEADLEGLYQRHEKPERPLEAFLASLPPEIARALRAALAAAIPGGGPQGGPGGGAAPDPADLD